MAIIDQLSTPISVGVWQGGVNAAPLPRALGVGLDTDDDLIAVNHISDDLVTNDDVLSEASIPDVDQLQLTTTDTTGGFVVAVWKKAE
jgi:hypothetical protein